MFNFWWGCRVTNFLRGSSGTPKNTFLIWLSNLVASPFVRSRNEAKEISNSMSHLVSLSLWCPNRYKKLILHKFIQRHFTTSDLFMNLFRVLTFSQPAPMRRKLIKTHKQFTNSSFVKYLFLLVTKRAVGDFCGLHDGSCETYENIWCGNREIEAWDSLAAAKMWRAFLTFQFLFLVSECSRGDGNQNDKSENKGKFWIYNSLPFLTPANRGASQQTVVNWFPITISLSPFHVHQSLRMEKSRNDTRYLSCHCSASRDYTIFYYSIPFSLV